MLPEEEERLEHKPLEAYSYESCMRNIAWISGFARHFKADDAGVSGFIQQTNDVTRMIPVQSQDKIRLADIRDEEAIKITGRVRGKIMVYEGVRTYCAFLDPLEVCSPNIFEMPSALTWNAPIRNRTESEIRQDDFQPFDPDSPDGELRDGANRVMVAGLVDEVIPLRDPEKGNALVGVEILVRQKENPDENIPVRLMNRSLASMVSKELSRGYPVLIQGKFRARDLKIVDENGVAQTTGQQAGYVWCKNITNARPGSDILEIPAWAEEIFPYRLNRQVG